MRHKTCAGLRKLCSTRGGEVQFILLAKSCIFSSKRWNSHKGRTIISAWGLTVECVWGPDHCITAALRCPGLPPNIRMQHSLRVIRLMSLLCSIARDSLQRNSQDLARPGLDLSLLYSSSLVCPYRQQSEYARQAGEPLDGRIWIESFERLSWKSVKYKALVSRKMYLFIVNLWRKFADELCFSAVLLLSQSFKEPLD